MADPIPANPATPATPPAPPATPPVEAPPKPAEAAPPKPVDPAKPAEPVTALGEDPDGKPKEEPKPADKTPPAPLQIKLPEGVQIEQSVLDGFTKLASDLGLDSDKAQKLLDFELSIGQKANEAERNTRSEWIKNLGEEAKSDKEIGGANWDKTMADASKAVRQFGTPELRKLFNESGLGNHKDMIRFIAKVGAALAEDKMPKAPGAPPAEQKTAEVLLYDNPTSQPVKG